MAIPAIASSADAVALRELGPAPGSELYYALLYAPPAARNQLALIESLRGLISAIPVQCSTPEIAVTKLAWWHDEIHRLGTPDARHALTRALADVAVNYPGLNTALFDLVNGTVGLLNRSRFDSAAERGATFAAIHSPLWRVHAAICGERDPAIDACVGQLGSAIELAQILRDLRRQVSAELAFISRDREPVLSAGVNDADWYAALAALEVPALLDTLTTNRRQLAAISSRPRRLQSLFALTEFAVANLHEIARDGHRVWERRVELTPLRKWWLAWRTRNAI